jgi:hypothetical protein
MLLVVGCGSDGGMSATESSSTVDAEAGSQAATAMSPGTADVCDTTTAGEVTGAGVTTAGSGQSSDDVCPEPRPVQIPVPALGCQPLMLLDEDDEPTRSPSGVDRCGSVLYRNADVPCPTGDDDECRCDAQCGPSQICLCAAEGIGSYNRCMLADCETADDCADGYCRFEENGCGLVALRCSSPTDDCVSDSDCVRTGSCAYDYVQEMFTCDGEGCIAE